MNTGAPVMVLKNVAYYYPRRTGYFRREKFWALRDISFSLFKGESLGVIGRNGCGKSTLMRLLAGITKPDRGSLINRGYTTSLLSLQAGFIPYLTGRENAVLNGLILGMEKQVITARLEDIKAFSGLEEFFEEPIGSYSSGMRARLGFSIAYQVDPDILLIDEVLGVGDEEFRKKSTQVMKERIRSDRTIVIVSHQAVTIRELCDRAVLIDQGRTLAEGSPEEILNAYSELIGRKKRK